MLFLTDITPILFRKSETMTTTAELLAKLRRRDDSLCSQAAEHIERLERLLDEASRTDDERLEKNRLALDRAMARCHPRNRS